MEETGELLASKIEPPLDASFTQAYTKATSEYSSPPTSPDPTPSPFMTAASLPRIDSPPAKRGKFDGSTWAPLGTISCYPPILSPSHILSSFSSPPSLPFLAPLTIPPVRNHGGRGNTGSYLVDHQAGRTSPEVSIGGSLPTKEIPMLDFDGNSSVTEALSQTTEVVMEVTGIRCNQIAENTFPHKSGMSSSTPDNEVFSRNTMLPSQNSTISLQKNEIRPSILIPESFTTQTAATSPESTRVFNEIPTPKLPAGMSSSTLPLAQPTRTPPRAVSTPLASPPSLPTTISSPVASLSPFTSVSISQGDAPPSVSQRSSDSLEAMPTLRKGKYVSPVWKAREMLWLAKAWRLQICGESTKLDGDSDEPLVRPKARSEKDQEVAKFLKENGVRRDAKIAATKWDNMLGEFRKVHEWERGTERQEVGKSYFKLSAYERKCYRLPASFDDEVYEELAQIMVHRRPPLPPRMSRGESTRSVGLRVPWKNGPKDSPKPVCKDLSKAPPQGRIPETRGAKLQQGSDKRRGTSLGRIGKVKMVWDESFQLWGEDGDNDHGRLRLENVNFFNANELVFLDDNWTGNVIEAFEEGPLRGFSTDTFVPGQILRVLGRRNSVGQSPPTHSAANLTALPDRTKLFLGSLKTQAPSIPPLSELATWLQVPPRKEHRFPVQIDVYNELPPGKDTFFEPSLEIDCRDFIHQVVAPLLRPPHVGTTKESFIGLWDDCINRVVKTFCEGEMVFDRNPGYGASSTEMLRPNVTGLIRHEGIKFFCVWRGEESLYQSEPASEDDTASRGLMDKLLWTYGDLPYILGYHAASMQVTFCALSQDLENCIICTDLLSVSLSTPQDRMGTLIPCWNIARLLTTIAEWCSSHSHIHSDYEKINRGNGKVVEILRTQVKKIYPTHEKWASVIQIYGCLGHKIPFADYIHLTEEDELAVIFKPRGHPIKPTTLQQLIEALRCVVSALIVLHQQSFMHRDIRWANVMKKPETNEWFLIDFEDGSVAPQMLPHNLHRQSHAPEVSKGGHGVKVDIWAIGYLIKTSGIAVSENLRELQRHSMQANPDQRPSAVDCFQLLHL